MKQLFLHRNRLVQIPVNAFATLHELQWLMLQENRLYEFPLQALEPLNALQWLNLSTNHLSFAGDRFPLRMGNLVELYVLYFIFLLTPRMDKPEQFDQNYELYGFWVDIRTRPQPTTNNDVFMVLSICRLQGFITQRHPNHRKGFLPVNAASGISVRNIYNFHGTDSFYFCTPLLELW